MGSLKKVASVEKHSAFSSESKLPKPRKNLASRKIHTEGRIVAKKESASAGTRKKHRWRPGTVVLREVRRYQSSTEFLIAKAPFRRLVREIVSNLKDSFRMSATCVEALQESTELYVTSVLADANLCTLHANRVTVYPKDIQLALKLRGERL
ncbi:histone H3 variant V [Trypanosoma cruzi]|uniref:Histone H3 variant, putative n=2 Tax=Trypanosoma cruzi TaxID=5693 RepID=Q4CVE3_TRYCC|nr:histone H3 variant, putative [Trypanosoma cruzi]EAN84245.1 histone H3 variant, putative [Trypanosoma cruzi]PWV17385.1 histone H3 variant V [Trypanosoma cruzi]RNC47614.1 histone H3 variant [Trypanosoma cruzi]|eukprot:XP_806096.1 histone H3 variant [Trypanosoma cruzi strain CL Brener]